MEIKAQRRLSTTQTGQCDPIICILYYIDTLYYTIIYIYIYIISLYVLYIYINYDVCIYFTAQYVRTDYVDIQKQIYQTLGIRMWPCLRNQE